MDNKFSMPSAHAYILLGRLEGKYFEIGTGTRYIYNGEHPSDLSLSINDDLPGNGSGAFTCNVEVWRT